MDQRDLLVDAFGRLPELVAGAVDGLTPDQLRWAPAPGANSVGWLVWHLARVQDHHVADILDQPQVWALTPGWPERFGLPSGAVDTGYGHSAAKVASLRPESAQALLDYYAAVAEPTGALLAGVDAADLDRVVDERWDPPVTLGVRLISVLDDDLEHVGQAAYVRGLLLRTR